MTNTKPISEIRIGAIKAAIWENETTKGTRYNVTFSRLYKDGATGSGPSRLDATTCRWWPR